ncbi:rubredoxin-like domain-containing protein [Desulfatitalea tepidiphila]|uniref:rubredoxin-like domain-containing protein n=1 Tax=Desulfatitalea tepidiphila TaxID=1185843 RepID=UPI00350E4581
MRVLSCPPANGQMAICGWVRINGGGDCMAKWKCGNCGYELEAERPPERCPSCKQSCEFLDNTCYTPDCAVSGKDPRIK